MSHAALTRITALIPADQPAALEGLQKLRNDMAYMAPELERQRWDLLWTFLVDYVIPHHQVPWTHPIKTYWLSVVPKNAG